MRVLYQDDWFLAVDKPAGLLVHPSWLDRSATDFAQRRAEDLVGQKLHTLHRLDRPTSGVLLFGRTPEIARMMQQRFQERSINKEYLCIARGWTKNEGQFDQPLKEELDKIADKFADPNKDAQPALTHFTKLAHTEIGVPVGRYPKARYSLMLARPETGRKHQIRKHFRKASHHLIGDTKYGDGRHNRMFAQQFKWKDLCLRAYSLSFDHPITGNRLRIHAGLTEQWSELLPNLGWQVWQPLLQSDRLLPSSSEVRE